MEMFKESKIKPIVQVKVFASTIYSTLANDVNDFLKEKKIGSSELVDIKYQSSNADVTAMVIYKENISYGADTESR